jgi:hypothetical protein
MEMQMSQEMGKYRGKHNERLQKLVVHAYEREGTAIREKADKNCQLRSNTKDTNTSTNFRISSWTASRRKATYPHEEIVSLSLFRVHVEMLNDILNKKDTEK